MYMRYSFTSIPEKLPYPARIRAQLSTLHSKVVTYISGHYDGTYRCRKRTVDVLNRLSYAVVSGSSIDSSYDPEVDPFSILSQIPEPSDIRAEIGSLYLIERDVNWDVDISDVVYVPSGENSSDDVSVSSTQSVTAVESYNTSDSISDTTAAVSAGSSTITTDATLNSSSKSQELLQSRHEAILQKRHTVKSDLYLNPPEIPQFDTSAVFAAGVVDDCSYVVYCSLPKIPTVQNEISATTDSSMLLDKDFLNLFPTEFISTRSPYMYNVLPGVSYDKDMGVIFPITGFSHEQVFNNVIQYPHIYRLTKLVSGDSVNFYSTIEIDGELVSVSEFWKSSKDTEALPYSVDYIKEYVVRRYLLERDILGIRHKYPMVETLKPFLTLFAPESYYKSLGFMDTLAVAKQCVSARIAYKRSRNPVFRRLNIA